jgi:predicted aldo/keto reductase-like oxidoreductase
METRPFGKTGYAFPILSFGGGAIGNAQRCTEEEAIQVVNLALGRGIGYFDTAWEWWLNIAGVRCGLLPRFGIPLETERVASWRKA